MTAELTRARKAYSARALRRSGWISLVVGVLVPAVVLFGATVLLMQHGCQDMREPISSICVNPQRMTLSYVVSVATVGLHLLGIGSAIVLAIVSIVRAQSGTRWRSIGLLVIAAIVGVASAAMIVSASRIGLGLNGIGSLPATAATIALVLAGVPWAIFEQLTATRGTRRTRA